MAHAEGARDEFDDALFSEDIRRNGDRGDNVSQKVIDEEMELFASFSAQNSSLARGV